MLNNIHEVSTFLATRLAGFMVANRHGNQKWTKYRVAHYITGSEEISGSISDTTIGRFLDPAYPQEPSASTVRMVTEFLLKHKWITQDQLDLLSHSKEVQVAAALSDYFKAGKNPADRRLLKQLEGSYSNYILRAPYLLETQLILTHHEEEQLLTAYETMRLFKVSNNQQLQSFTENLQSNRQHRMPALLKVLGAELLTQHALSGAGVASAGMIMLLMKPATTGFSSTINIDAVNLTDEDDVYRLGGSRNSGWYSLDKGEVLAPYENTANSSPYSAMRSLCGKIEYYPQLIADIQRMNIDRRSKEVDSDGMKFHGTAPELPGQKRRNQQFMETIEKIIAKAVSLDQKLKLSIEWGSFVHFEKALNEGAKADLILEDSQLPLVFYLASLGRYEWVKALVELGNCDLACRDERGLPASHLPGVYAKILAKAPYASDLRESYVETARYLRDQEIQQERMQNATSPSPSL